MATAVPAGVAVGARLATVALAVPFNAFRRIHVTRAVVFTGTLHLHSPYAKDRTGQYRRPVEACSTGYPGSNTTPDERVVLL